MSSQVKMEGFRQAGVAQEIVLKAVSALKEAGVDDVIGMFALLEHGVICPSIRLKPEQEVPVLRLMEQHLLNARSDYDMDTSESF